MYSKILVPLSEKNLESRSAAALRHALSMRPGTVLLLNVAEPIPSLVGGEAHARLKRLQTEKGLTILEAAKKTAGPGPYVMRVVEGTVAESIVRVAHEERVDLIVMFTDGRDTLVDALLGSVTERVLRLSDIALLAVRR